MYAILKSIYLSLNNETMFQTRYENGLYKENTDQHSTIIFSGSTGAHATLNEMYLFVHVRICVERSGHDFVSQSY